MTSEQCDVLIVGAGPVGLLLALLLQQQGVHVIIVERQRSLYPLPRAVAFDHESRRIFGSAGLSKEIDGVLQHVIGKGGEDGINFVWRDADLKRESGMLKSSRLTGSISHCRPIHGVTNTLRIPCHDDVQSARGGELAGERGLGPEDPSYPRVR